MKRYLTITLALIWLMSACCPALAAVECTVPKAWSGETEMPDVLMIGGVPGENAVLDAPADRVTSDQPNNGKYSSMGALYQAWGGYEGYPDYICGVWSTDGGMTNMTVAVTKDEAGEKGKAEILSLLENPNTVTFTTQMYSYQELNAVNEEIVAQMFAGGLPINACGIHEMENVVRIDLLETAENAQQLAQKLIDQYGNKVQVTFGPAFNTLVEETDTQAEAIPGVLLVLLAVALVVVIIMVAKLSVRHINKGT